MGYLWNEEAAGLKQRWIVCVPAVTECLVSKFATWIVIRTYKFWTSNRTFPPLSIFVSRNPCYPPRGALGFHWTQFEKSCSMGWFVKKLIVVWVVVGLQYMSVSVWDSFRMSSQSTKFICLLSSYFGLSVVLLFVWFMSQVLSSASLFVQPCTVRMPATYRV